jgi:phosphohistidine swiveling domain-containing protein
MTPTKKSKQLVFIKAMEINGISPLPHYFEEIYTNRTGIRKLGLRGDENYLFHSVNGLGAGYYERHEMELSAQSVYKFFQTKQHRVDFFKKIERLLQDLHVFSEMLDEEDLSALSDKQIAQYFLEANRMHGRAFSLYIVSQPYRMAIFEKNLRYELGKRVAASRIDSYLAELATSEKPTKVTAEELDWLRFLIKYKTKYGNSLSLSGLRESKPDMYSDLVSHFEKYRTLTLGDGNWTYDIKHYLNNLKNDYPKDLKDLKKSLNERSGYPGFVKARRNLLISELYLTQETVDDLAFLADIGHTRLVMRIDGWLPFVSTIIKLDIELSKRLDVGDVLNYMTEEELVALAENGDMVPERELLARKKTGEFLILNDHGSYRIFYGAEANKKFKSLVPEVDHAAITELKGSTAVMGKITGKACVYRWDDNLEKKLEVIKKNPILITGQTRPSMMPIIRLAKGIATDEGGVTSHAAIVSRELGIPAVIGTVHATKVFKDGDLVEIDADNGVVRKLS